jgi:tetratricopeptide (TPR) repeat protein
MRFWNQLRERGVWRNLVLYIGIGWGLVESLDFFVSRYQLSDALVDILLLGLLGLLPLAMWLGWRLGAPDGQPGLRWRDGWFGLIYAGLLAGGLYAGFNEHDLGRATVKVASVDEEGARVVRERPRLDLIRSVALTPFAVEGAQSPRWLGLGVSEGLLVDLSQHRFLTLSFSWRSDFLKAYLKDGGAIPLSLLARQAKASGARYFITGSASGTPESASARIEIHQVEPLQRLHAFELRDRPLLQLIDEASIAIKPHLDLSAARAAGDDDLPVVELLSRNPEALAAFFEADLLLMLEDDYRLALAKVEQALELDPEFAMAALRVASLGHSMGRFDIAKAAYAKAMPHLHRLTPTLQCIVRANHAAFATQSERAQRIAKGCVDMFPNDALARTMYAGMLALAPDTLAEAIAQYEALYALGPANDSALLQLAKLKNLTGDEAGAIAALTTYREAHPEETATASQLAEMLSRRGAFSEAEEILQDALGRQDSVALTSSLVNLLLRQGRLADAERALAQLTPSGPTDTIAVAASRAQILTARGRESEAITSYDEALRLVPAGLLPQFELMRLSQYSGNLLRRDGLAAIDAELERLVPAKDELSRANRDIYRALVVIHGQDLSALATAKQVLETFIASSKREDMRFLLSLIRARQRHVEGKGSAAAALFEQAHQQMLRSPTRLGVGEGLLLRWWLETANSGASAAELEKPEALAERGFPGNASLLMARADAASLHGDSARARALLERGLPLLEGADPGYPALLVGERVRARLAESAP